MFEQFGQLKVIVANIRDNMIGLNRAYEDVCKKYQQLQTDYDKLKMEYDKLKESTKGSTSEDNGDN